MAITNDRGDWIDSRGAACPAKFIPPVEKRRDAAVERIHKIGKRLEEQMRKAKKDVLDELDAYLEWLDKNSDAPRSRKGNTTLTNYSGDKQVELAMDDVVKLDERLQQAKELVDEYVASLGESAPDELTTLAHTSFDTDKSGRVNQALVLRLVKYQFKDERWQRAVQLIRESIQVVGTRQYLQLRILAPDESGAKKWARLHLNFSAM